MDGVEDGGKDLDVEGEVGFCGRWGSGGGGEGDGRLGCGWHFGWEGVL